MFICFVFSFAIDAFAERLAKFMAVAIDIDMKRPKPRFWAPSGFGKLGRKIMSRRDIDKRVMALSLGTSDDPTNFDDRDDGSDEGDVLEEDIPEDKPTRRKNFLFLFTVADNITLGRNPDALAPTTAFGKFFLRLGSILRFFRSPEGIFSLRHAVVSVALWIPSVCTSSAWFYYGNRGIWALIMAQVWHTSFSFSSDMF